VARTLNVVARSLYIARWCTETVPMVRLSSKRMAASSIAAEEGNSSKTAPVGVAVGTHPVGTAHRKQSLKGRPPLKRALCMVAYRRPRAWTLRVAEVVAVGVMEDVDEAVAALRQPEWVMSDRLCVIQR
jgi:hypothetical protein